MQLLLVLAVVAAVSISESAPHQPVSNVGVRLILAVLAMAVAPLFAAATSSIIASSLRRDFDRKRETLRWFSRLRHVHSVLWLGLALIVLHQIGWVRLVRFNWHFENIFLLDDVLIFLPIVAPLVLSWAAFYEVELGLYGAASSTSRGQYVGLQVRHYLGLLFLPVLSVLAVQDLVQHFGTAIPAELQAWLLVLPVAGLLVFFPLVLRRIWRTEPIPAGELRKQLIGFSRAAGFNPSELLVWRTDRMMVNAAVTGLVRPWRYVFFTDVLLAKFTPDEVEAALGHEIGHVRRHHLFERVAIIALPVLLWFAFDRALPELTESLVNGLATLGLAAEAQAALAAPVGLALYAATLFAYHARLLEHDADLFAARACGSTSGLSPGGCRRMADVLEKLAIVAGMDRHARSWLHPTIAQRIGFLHGVAADPVVGTQFERRMRHCRWTIVAILAAAIAYLAATPT